MSFPEHLKGYLLILHHIIYLSQVAYNTIHDLHIHDMHITSGILTNKRVILVFSMNLLLKLRRVNSL